MRVTYETEEPMAPFFMGSILFFLILYTFMKNIFCNEGDLFG